MNHRVENQYLEIVPPSPEETYSAAKAYVAAGLSVIPIALGGKKSPAFELLPRQSPTDPKPGKRTWSPYKTRLPTLEELALWFDPTLQPIPVGIAILGGPVSGGLEIIDFDQLDRYEPWAEKVEKAAPGLLSRLVRVKSPRPGMHVYFRSATPGGNTKLARRSTEDPESGKPTIVTLIETKADRGYVLAPNSPLECHRSGRPYLVVSDRDLTEIPTVTLEERDTLLVAARELNEFCHPRRKRPETHRSDLPLAERPGDDFNERGDWGELLEPFGWQFDGMTEESVEDWTRPGKSEGVSARVNFFGDNRLYVFTTNAHPLEPQRSYSLYQAYTLLHHKGDFKAAARALRGQGYGGGPTQLLSRRDQVEDPAKRPLTIKQMLRQLSHENQRNWYLRRSDSPD